MPDVKRALPVAAATAVLLALTCMLLAFVALGIGLAGSLEVRTVIVLRGVLVLVGVVLICRAAAARAARRGLPAPVPAVLAGALIGYALYPGAWSGHAVLSQLVTGAGPAAAAGDLVLWVAAAVAAAGWGSSRQGAAQPAATSYG